MTGMNRQSLSSELSVSPVLDLVPVGPEGWGWGRYGEGWCRGADWDHRSRQGHRRFLYPVL